MLGGLECKKFDELVNLWNWWQAKSAKVLSEFARSPHSLGFDPRTALGEGFWMGQWAGPWLGALSE